MIATFTLNLSIDRRYIVENSAVGRVNRVKECVLSPGGKGLNVARVVHALGEPVLACGIAGGDAGRYIARRLDAEGIAHSFTEARGESRSCINICDIASGTQTEYLEPGEPVSPEEQQRFFEDFEKTLERCSVLTVSGSLPKGMPADTYAKLAKAAKAKGKKLFLDASGEALKIAAAAAPYYIKPNEDEISALTSAPVDRLPELARAAQSLCSSGIDRVVVSMGARGALLACSDGVLVGEPPAIKPVNTVGCGDSMTAAFAVAQMRGLGPEEALHLAVAVSCASALSPATGGLEKNDLEAVFPKVRVYSIL